jgi:hypothetical protein
LKENPGVRKIMQTAVSAIRHHVISRLCSPVKIILGVLKTLYFFFDAKQLAS